MSIVACQIKKDYIEISADQQVTWGDSYKEVTGMNYPENSSKLFEVNNMIIGGSGNTQEFSFLRLFAKNHRPAKADINSVLEYLVEFSDWVRKKDSNFKLSNCLILVFDGKVFETIHLEVREVKDYTATGSGMFLALGAMEMGADTKKAVDVAKKYDLYCGGETISKRVELNG